MGQQFSPDSSQDSTKDGWEVESHLSFRMLILGTNRCGHRRMVSIAKGLDFLHANHICNLLSCFLSPFFPANKPYFMNRSISTPSGFLRPVPFLGHHD
jgi:hypothetical protein